MVRAFGISGLKTGFNLIMLHFCYRGKLFVIRCYKYPLLYSYFSELSVKIELAKDLTEEAVQICQLLFTDKHNLEKKISSHHLDNVSFFSHLKNTGILRDMTMADK